ncbi:MAG TPA: CopD family protein [Xanthobacteraceae bacterium]
MLVLLLALHILAAVFWVGGMAFAYTVLRPAAGPLEPAMRLGLWRRVFARFLPAVGASIVVLLVSGYGMQFALFGGFRGVPLYVHLMQGLGIVMMLLFLHLVFAPWRRFRMAVDGGVMPEAARYLNQIRMIVAANLVLGALTIIVGSTGRYW